MPLIDKTYFVGEINIAQLGQLSVQERLAVFISQHEVQYMRAVLGYAFAKLAYTGMTETNPDARWNDLKTGAEYTDAKGILQYWDGFVNSNLVSPLANYIYYWYTRDNTSNTTASGEKQDSAGSATNINPKTKQMRAWNAMVDMHCKLYDFLIHKKDENGAKVYPEFIIDNIKRSDEFLNVNRKMNILGI